MMGGFVVDTSSIHDTFLQVTLTPLGVELLAREGLFLEMSNDQIADRSKANILAKSLVCIQITWMLIQCAARKSAGYPLTPLEIHTMVHVVCALCIYGLWWHVRCSITLIKYGTCKLIWVSKEAARCPRARASKYYCLHGYHCSDADGI